jgi:hypothetical protein
MASSLYDGLPLLGHDSAVFSEQVARVDVIQVFQEFVKISAFMLSSPIVSKLFYGSLLKVK